MRRHVILLVTGLLTIGPHSVRASWQGSSGNILANAVYGDPTAVVADGSGGVLIAFGGEGVAGGAAIRLLRVLGDGTVAPGWPSAAAVACSLASPASLGTLKGVSDGNGGAFLVWLEQFFWGNTGTAYVQHVLADGSRSPGWPARGRQLVNSTGQSFMNLLPDGSGGVFACWQDTRTGTTADIRVIRVRANGTTVSGFPPAGLVISAAQPGAAMLVPSATRDGSAGYWISWTLWSSDTLQTPSRQQLVHLNSAGALDLDWSDNGYTLPIQFSAQAMGGTAALGDGSGGAYVMGVAIDQDDEGEARLYHVLGDLSADPAWPAAGLQLGRGSGLNDVAGSRCELSADGIGGLYAEWPAATDINFSYGSVRRVLTSGALDPSWPEPDTLAGMWHGTMIADPQGVFVSGDVILGVCAHQNCFAESYIGRRSTDGSIPAGWALGPYPSFAPIGSYNLSDSSFCGPTSMAADGAGGVIVAWTDPVLGPQGRYGQAGYLRAMRFVAAGPVAGVTPLAAGGLSVKQARFNGGIIATVGWRGVGEGTLEVFDLLGRRMASKPFAPSVRPVEQHVQGTEELGAGLYFIRARAGQFTATTRVLVVR